MQTESKVIRGKDKAQRYCASLTVQEVAHLSENLDLFHSICNWIRNYLAQPHPELGRSGSVCPFAGPAIAKDTLRIAVVRLNSATDRRAQIIEAIKHHRDIFVSTAGSGEVQMLRSTLVLFPDVRQDEAPDLIDRIKEELKSEFVEQGLMLGEFHLQNESPGLHNPAFKPLRSPIPMLVIRRMVTTDRVFLDRSVYDAATRLRYLETYLNVSPITDPATSKEVERSIALLRKEVRTSHKLAS